MPFYEVPKAANVESVGLSISAVLFFALALLGQWTY